ncbi:MAG: Biopolymer transport protein ExbD/TolR [uncultured bacterium]|uniref:Biopolymer transporter ExbD n=1 Tax=Candidatus Wallbacteria bacterium GWC2_49_35 TaxID=1817813 RepID=A0A1F7WNV6_9BACT|nr:MAG: Biopolymer transport protein ExbD/TolR [uncultured bacterium]OGM04531.1 MAG: hypothetical protein A2008_07650 [Candidatus Wallbacteria bacterium GWC2_49_35]
MSRRGRHGEDFIADINITPFTDVVLVLLIIFMVAAPYIPKNAMTLNLPESKESAPIGADEKKIHDIIVFSSTEVSLNEATMPVELLAKSVEAIISSGTAEIFTVSADASASYQEVITVLDVLKKQAVSEVYLKTEAAEGRRR